MASAGGGLNNEMARVKRRIAACVYALRGWVRANGVLAITRYLTTSDVGRGSK